MNFALFVARRYLFAPKSHQAVNLITGISFIGVSIITSALVVVLSVFNGFEGLINSLYSTFDPDIKITPSHGKFIFAEKFPEIDTKIKSVQMVNKISYCLEEQALLRYKDKQYIARIKGVDSNFVQITGINSMVREGTATLEKDSNFYGIMGMGIAYYLGVPVEDYFNPVQIFIPNRMTTAALNPAEAFYQSSIVVKGIFSIEQSFDVKYLLVPLGFAEEALMTKGQYSSIEISLNPNSDAKELSKELSNILGNSFTVKTRAEQNEALFKILESEKFYGYLIGSFIFLLAVINVSASMIMLIIEKRGDTAILGFLGANNSLRQKVFIMEGMLIILTGLIIGLSLGVFLCWVQSEFGLIKLQETGSFIVNYYPVILKGSDLVLITLTVISIGYFTVFATVKAMFREKKRIIKALNS